MEDRLKIESCKSIPEKGDKILNFDDIILNQDIREIVN